jgi:nucleoside 2-deoxyribosyltransferase
VDSKTAQLYDNDARSGQDAHAPVFGVYVAAAATPDAITRVDAAIAALRADGFVVTSTWPEMIAAVGNANPRDASVAERRGWSTQDLDEIDEADALWFLVPDLPATTRGAWFEAGYAYSSHKHIVFSGDTKQSIFCALGREFETDAAALIYLRELRERERSQTLARLHVEPPRALANFTSPRDPGEGIGK